MNRYSEAQTNVDYSLLQRDSLDDAAQWYQRAKAGLQTAKAALEAAERALLDQVTNDQQEGTASQQGERFKVSVTNKLTRTLDEKAIAALPGNVPDDIIRVCFKTKHSLSLKSYRDVLEANASYVPHLQACVTTKPAKPSVKVELI